MALSKGKFLLQRVKKLDQKSSESAEPSVDKLDRLLGKYVSVWIWSIILASSAGVTYTLPRPQEFFDYGTFGLALLAIYLMVGVTALMALMSALRFFKGFILPTVLLGDDHRERERPEYAEMNVLYKAAYFLVMATFLRVMLGIAMAAVTLTLR